MTGSMPVSKADVRRYAPERLALSGRAVSPQAKALVDHCLNVIVLPSLSGQQLRPSSLSAVERATEGLLAGLILADGWQRRPLSHASFQGEAVSRLAFLRAYQPLSEAGLIDTVSGHFDRAGPQSRGHETRMKLSEAGRELGVQFGLRGPEDWRTFVPSIT